MPCSIVLFALRWWSWPRSPDRGGLFHAKQAIKYAPETCQLGLGFPICQHGADAVARPAFQRGLLASCELDGSLSHALRIAVKHRGIPLPVTSRPDPLAPTDPISPCVIRPDFGCMAIRDLPCRPDTGGEAARMRQGFEHSGRGRDHAQTGDARSRGVPDLSDGWHRVDWVTQAVALSAAVAGPPPCGRTARSG